MTKFSLAIVDPDLNLSRLGAAVALARLNAACFVLAGFLSLAAAVFEAVFPYAVLAAAAAAGAAFSAALARRLSTQRHAA